MTTTELSSKKSFFTPSLRKRMLFGAGIGLMLISIFVIGAGKGEADWGNYWRVKPLILTPLLGSIVGLCYDITEPLRAIKGWAGKIFWVLSLLGYFVGIWISLVLGLAGTMWD